MLRQAYMGLVGAQPAQGPDLTRNTLGAIIFDWRKRGSYSLSAIDSEPLQPFCFGKPPRANDVCWVLCFLGIAQRYSSTFARGPMAGALIGVPVTSNIEPWHGQSQHASKLFQCRWQPTWVQLAEFRCSAPASSRYAAIFVSPRRTIPPSPGIRSSSEVSSPGATYSAKLFSAVTFSVKKFFAAFSGTRPGA